MNWIYRRELVDEPEAGPGPLDFPLGLAHKPLVGELLERRDPPPLALVCIEESLRNEGVASVTDGLQLAPPLIPELHVMRCVTLELRSRCGWIGPFEVCGAKVGRVAFGRVAERLRHPFPQRDDSRHTETTVTVERWMLDIEPPPFWRKNMRDQYPDFDGDVDRWQIIHVEAPSTIIIDAGAAKAGTGAPEGDRSHGVNG